MLVKGKIRLNHINPILKKLCLISLFLLQSSNFYGCSPYILPTPLGELGRNEFVEDYFANQELDVISF